MPWSDWQPTIDRPFPVTPNTLTYHNVGAHDSNADTTSPADPTAKAEGLVETIQAATITGTAAAADADGVSYTGPTGNSTSRPANESLDVRRTAHDLGPRLTVQVVATQVIATVTDPGHDTDLDFGTPGILASLIFGVDYDNPPGGGSYIEYEDSTQPRIGWADWTFNTGYSWVQQTNGPAGIIYAAGYAPSVSVRLTTDPDFTYDAVSATLSGSSYPTSSWAPPDEGTELVRVDLAATTTAGVSSGTASPTVPLASVADADTWTVVMQSSVFRDTAPTLDPQIDDTPGSAETSATAALTPTDLVSSFGTPQVLYRQPRFRYWIPDNGPLRTIGDHFRSVGGADIKSLIPGVGWVKVRRGT